MHAPMVHSLKSTLTQIYKLDEAACALIADKLSVMEASPIEAFIRASTTLSLTPVSQQCNATVYPLDALLTAPKTHLLLFENDYVRILEARIEPGESVPIHTHQWDSIYCIIQGSHFRGVDRSGNVIEEVWNAGVEQWKGDTPDSILYAYTNIGPQTFLALAFEIKK